MRTPAPEDETFGEWLARLDPLVARVDQMLKTRLDWMGTSSGLLMFGSLLKELRDELISSVGMPGDEP